MLKCAWLETAQDSRNIALDFKYMEDNIMIRTLVCTIFALAVAVFSLPSRSGPMEDGAKAASAGDYETAFEQWKLLSGSSMFSLALMYHAASQVPRNEEIAVRLYHMAAANGERMAQEYLAAGYENGWFGLPVSRERAAYWRGKAGILQTENVAAANSLSP
jgi:TPR repeat protein